MWAPISRDGSRLSKSALPERELSVRRAKFLITEAKSAGIGQVPADKPGKGCIYNFVTKRGDCRGRNAEISWTHVETGSAIA
jgi:Fe-S cluster assembly scaffold protein SufB